MQFLSVLPVNVRFATDDIGRSLVWFPAAGLVIGMCAALGHGLLRMAGMPPLVCALAGVLLLAGCSGFLHLDGVADTADGFFSARDRDRMLAIMRDSRIGAMGVMGIFSILALKWAALASLPPDLIWRALVLAPIAGRAGQILTLHHLPYARPEGGLASLFLAYRSRQTMITAAAAAIGAAALLAGERGLLALGIAALFGFAFNLWCRRKIGGMTGDTLGAVSELTETVLLCALTMGRSPS